MALAVHSFRSAYALGKSDRRREEDFLVYIGMGVVDAGWEAASDENE
jgi:hypothetical protein